MNNCKRHFRIPLFFICLLATIAIIDFTPLSIDWGSVAMRPASTITVTGEAKKDEKNQIANFTVGFEAIETSKEEATQAVTEKMNAALDALKKFDIPEEDIQTERVSVYQETEYFEEDDRYEAEKGDWRAYNSISIKLKNLDQSEEIVTVLNESEATDINGPNFSLDDTNSSETELLADAITDARAKAEKMAAANNQKVKKIITIVEGSSNIDQPVLFKSIEMAAGMGVADNAIMPDLEIGSTTVSKTVTVTFELR
jgi:uncharacterized protein YggE